MKKLQNAIAYHQRAARACFKNAERYREADRKWLCGVYQDAAKQNSTKARLLLFYLLKRERNARTQQKSSL